ncbi:MAG: ABC transporter ATP-binding protein [Rickettsiales bacterium]|nr:ABC transporter ATP-binding protein [Rickettsiales bacterium]
MNISELIIIYWSDMSNLAISISDLRKIYSSKISKEQKEALKNISLDIEKGQIFGLLGPNGAGKSTLINIIAGLVNKTSGKVLVNGIDLDKQPEKLRANIGIVPQEVVIDPFFNVYDTLEYYAGYYGIRKKDRRTDEILKALSLEDKKDFNPRRLSGGMKRRLLVAKALVHNPPIIILDEPTAGVDVELRSQLWEYVRKLNKEGTTILLTTHYLEEAEQLCDKIAVINKGEIIANDTTKNLKDKLGIKKIFFHFSEKLESNNILEGYEVINNGLGICITYKKDDFQLDKIINQIQNLGAKIKDVKTEESNLEDIFKTLVKAA